MKIEEKWPSKKETVMSIEQNIQQIGLEEDEELKLELFNQVKMALLQTKNRGKIRYLISLLYDGHWYIRQEAAFLIDQLGLKLSGEDYARYLLALQDFENLFLQFNDPLVRKIIFETLRDANHRLRSKIFKYLKFEDCKTWEEQALFWYGQAEYEKLVSLAENAGEAEAFIKQLLCFGMKAINNPHYHRRRCAETLQQLEDSAALQAFINELLNDNRSSTKKAANLDLRPVPLQDQEPDLNFCLQTVIAQLKENGIWVDGRLIFPEIRIGSVTNRITYRNPPVQTWPKTEREEKIQAPSGKERIAFDFVSIEPTLLLHFLVQHFYLALSDLPREDVYLAFYPEDRPTGKRLFNTLINGGMVNGEQLKTPFARIVVESLTEFRLEQASLARKNGYVKTLGGQHISIARDTANFSGKVLNRLIQGSASDVFNQALCAVHEKSESKDWQTQIYFVLFDEMWLTVPKGQSAAYLQVVGDLLNNLYREFNLLVPLRCRGKRLPS